MRCLRGRCSVSGVCDVVSAVTAGLWCFTYAFRGLDVVLDYAPHALVFRAHVGADAVQLDRIAQAHLAFWVHSAFVDESLAQQRPRRSDLSGLAPSPADGACPTYMFEPLGVVILGERRRVRAAGGI